MKNRSRFLLFIIFFIIIFSPIGFSTKINNLNVWANSLNKYSKNNDTAEIVMEINSKRILHEKNIHKKMFMASTTKILTAITIIENMDLAKKVTVSKETIGVEGSSIYLEEGETLSVEDLLFGLMLRSGNDCAVTLALACSGSIDSFAILMNEMASKIGAKDSNFVNPHGLHDDNHYTTAYDLALISSYAIKNPHFERIVSTKKAIIPFTTRGTKRVLINKNKMLSSFDGATGIKTGYTKNAGRCLVTSAKRNNLELVCVVLNCYNMWERSTSLLNDFFDCFKYRKLLNSNDFVDFINVKSEKIGVYIKKDFNYPLTNNEEKELKIFIKYDYCKNSNVKKDSNIGKIHIYLKNNLIFSQNVYNIVDIKN